MTVSPPIAYFDTAQRGRLISPHSSVRMRWPAAANLVDMLGRVAVRRYEALLSDRRCVEHQFRAFVGQPLNLDRPRLLCEKVQWLKLYDVTPLHTICADKIRARDYVRDRVGDEYLIPALLISDDPADINPAAITAPRFAAKTNHDWGGVVLCHDRDRFDWAAARAKLANHLRTPFWKRFRELAYRDIPPGIIVERLIEGPDGGLPSDYKLFCFHGEPAIVQVVDGRDGWPTWTMYDLDWNMLPVWRRGRPRTNSIHQRPASLDRMIEIARTLSEPFKFCRVDLYQADDRIYFGEIAFSPEAGYRPFEPMQFEHRFGEMVRLD